LSIKVFIQYNSDIVDFGCSHSHHKKFKRAVKKIENINAHILCDANPFQELLTLYFEIQTISSYLIVKFKVKSRNLDAFKL